MWLVFSQSYCIYKDSYLQCQILYLMRHFLCGELKTSIIKPIIQYEHYLIHQYYIWGVQAVNLWPYLHRFIVIPFDEGNLQ